MKIDPGSLFHWRAKSSGDGSIQQMPVAESEIRGWEARP